MNWGNLEETRKTMKSKALAGSRAWVPQAHPQLLLTEEKLLWLYPIGKRDCAKGNPGCAGNKKQKAGGGGDAHQPKQCKRRLLNAVLLS